MKVKRINSPGTWSLQRKHGNWVTDPRSGNKRSESLSLSHVMKLLGICASTREVKKLISERKILLNGKNAKSYNLGMGLFDVVTVHGENKSWRLVYNDSHRLSLINCKDSDKKIVRVEGKQVLPGGKGLQLNLSGGLNIISTKKNASTGDSLLISLPDLKILDHFKPSKGSLVYVIGGSYKGTVARVHAIKKIASAEPDIYTLKTKDGEFNTRKTSVFVIGNEKEAVQVS